MRILGIDPGYATTGFGILQAERASVQLINYGTITTPTTLSFPERLEMLYDDMAELLDTVRPDAVAVEELFWGHNVTTGIGVSHGRGVILLAICQAHTPRCASSLLRRLPVQVAAKKCSFTKALASGSQHPRLSGSVSFATFLPHCIWRYSFPM